MHPFEIITFNQRGRIDTAHADTPEQALTAARTLLDDAHGANRACGYTPTATILHDGISVRAGLRRKDL